MPVSYIEGFSIEDKKVRNLNLPLKPKKIFSSNINGKSLLTRYCAIKKEHGAKLILATHGGSYGHYDILFSEKFEKKVSDLYLTWGWKDKNNPKVKPFGIIRPLFKLKKKVKPSLLTMIVPATTLVMKVQQPLARRWKRTKHFTPWHWVLTPHKVVIVCLLGTTSVLQAPKRSPKCWWSTGG